MLAQKQLDTTTVCAMYVADRPLPYGVVAMLHNATGGTITAAMYLDAGGGLSDIKRRLWSGTLAAGATQPVEVRGQIAFGATFSFLAGTANALNVLLLEGSPQ